MEAVLNIARELSSALTESDAYMGYMRAKEKIAENDVLNGQLQEFKRAQLDFEVKSMQNIEPPFSDEQYLSKLYAKLMLDENAREFLLNERKLLTLINEINSIILQSCKIDLDFL